MIVTKSVRAYRRMSGAMGAELLVTVKLDGDTEWSKPYAHEIHDMYGSPWAMVDGHRYELKPHEVTALAGTIKDVEDQEKNAAEKGPQKFRRFNSGWKRAI